MFSSEVLTYCIFSAEKSLIGKKQCYLPGGMWSTQTVQLHYQSVRASFVFHAAATPARQQVVPQLTQHKNEVLLLLCLT